MAGLPFRERGRVSPEAMLKRGHRQTGKGSNGCEFTRSASPEQRGKAGLATGEHEQCSPDRPGELAPPSPLLGPGGEGWASL